jgi:hypothetical protein
VCACVQPSSPSRCAGGSRGEGLALLGCSRAAKWCDAGMARDSVRGAVHAHEACGRQGPPHRLWMEMRATSRARRCNASDQEGQSDEAVHGALA